MAPLPPPPGRVAGVILAAGASRRFGSAKQLARLGGRTLLEHVLAAAAAAGLDPLLAVLPPGLALPAKVPVRRIENPDSGLGMSRSLQLGLAAVPLEAEAAVVLLGDNPVLPPRVLNGLLAGRGTRPVVACWVDGHPVPPILLERSAFRLADSLTGDRGLGEVLQEHPELVTRVDLAGTPPDVDTPDDLARLEAAR